MKGKFIIVAAALAAFAPAVFAGPNIQVCFPAPEIIIRPRERVIIVRPEAPPPVMVAHPPAVPYPVEYPEYRDERCDQREHGEHRKHRDSEKKKKWKDKKKHCRED